MSVIQRDRKTASTEYMNNAIKLHRTILYQILKDFGAKKHIKDLVFVKEHLDEETLIRVAELEDVLRQDNVVMKLEPPEHYLDHLRRKFYYLISSFMHDVTFVYSSWATTKSEHQSRLYKTTNAISTLYTIKREYAIIHDVLKIKLKTFMMICNMVDTEIKLLNGVRDSIRRTLKNVYGEH